MLSPCDMRDQNPMGSTSTIPLPMMASTESLRVNSFERNTGNWYLFKHNWRQLTSLVPGKHAINICLVAFFLLY